MMNGEKQKNKNKRGKKSRKEIEMIRGMGKKKRNEQRKSNDGEKVFCLWRFWVYYL